MVLEGYDSPEMRNWLIINCRSDLKSACIVNRSACTTCVDRPTGTTGSDPSATPFGFLLEKRDRHSKLKCLV